MEHNKKFRTNDSNTESIDLWQRAPYSAVVFQKVALDLLNIYIGKKNIYSNLTPLTHIKTF